MMNKKLKNIVDESSKQIDENIYSSLLTIFGKEKINDFLKSLKQQEHKHIRFNISKLRKDFRLDLPDEEIAKKYIKYLNLNKIFLLETEISKFSFSYQVQTSHFPIGATPDYLRGYYYISNLASHIPVISLNPKKGERILDLCAAPGGKSVHIGDMMNNEGLLVCNEIDINRTKSLISNLQRCGIKNALVTNMDGKKMVKFCKDFDRILLDAPCSGSGLIGNDKNQIEKRNFQEIKERVSLQKELILASIDMLKKNGILVYSTCSVLIEENEEIIDYALKKRNIKILNVYEELEKDFDFGFKGITRNKDKKFDDNLIKSRRFYPHLNRTIGFFVVKIQKIN